MRDGGFRNKITDVLTTLYEGEALLGQGRAEMFNSNGDSDQCDFEFVKATGTINPGFCLQRDVTDPTGHSVKQTSAATVPFAGVAPCVLTSPTGGAAPTTITSGQYFWMQKRGLARVRCAASITATDPVILAPSGVSGTAQLAPFTATNGVVQSIVGSLMETTVGAGLYRVKLAQ